MKHNKLTFAIITIIVLILLSINVYNQLIISKYKTKTKENRPEAELQLMYDQMKNKVFADQYFYLTPINADKAIYNPEKLKNESIREIAADKPLFVFRFSNNDCDVCIDKLIEQLKKMGAAIGFEKIIFISDFIYPRQIGIFMREHDINFKVYSFAKFEFGTELDKQTPYFFILDTDFLMKNLFVAFHSYEVLNEEFFNLITKKYFSQK